MKKRRKEKSADLFNLIKGLTMQEKRYFSIFSRRHILGEQNNYLKLFEAIDRQKVYNEDVLLKVFSNEIFVKQFHVAKNRLYELILKSLRVFLSKKTVRMEMAEQIDFIEIMLLKKQWKQCEKYIKRALLFASDYELFTSEIEILKFQQLLMRARSDVRILERSIEPISLKERNIIKKLANYHEYKRAFFLMDVALAKQHHSRAGDEGRMVQSKFDKSLFSNIKNALSDSAIIVYHNVNGIQFALKGDFTKSLFHFETLKQFIITNTGRFKQYYNVYVNTLYNIINVLQNQNPTFTNIIAQIDDLKKMPSNMILIDVDILAMYYVLKLNTYIRFQKFKDSHIFLEEIEEWFQQINEGLIKRERLHILYCILSYMFYGIGEYRKSLVYSSKANLEFGPEIQQLNGLYASILTIMSNFELGNDEICISLIRSLLRIKKRRKIIGEIGFVVLNFIYFKYYHINSKAELVSEFLKLKKRVGKLLKINSEVKLLEYFNFTHWIDCKILNLPFGEELQKTKM